jgi:sterol desaturase/sphingolipid hydroxylase (fatty acid hydroxylase superfamily)
MLHRFLFHMKVGKSFTSKLCHFMIHGIHHKTPFDELRLVFPPVPATLIVFLLYSAIHFVCSFLGDSCNPRFIICGALVSYLMYDLTHYYLHHSNPSSQYFYNLKRYHNYHHFVNHDMGYGVSSMFWDKVFRTENTMKDLKFRLNWHRTEQKSDPVDVDKC